jgi:DNA-binding MarR family transcriptional regulator
MGMRIADVSALSGGIEQLTRWLLRQSPRSMSRTSLAALDRLSTEGPLRVSELAAREAITQPGVTVLVNRLSEAGYAERVPDPTDGRAALVRITAAGKKVLADRSAARTQSLRERLSELSDDDQQLLLAALPAIERLVATPTHPGPRKSRS